MNLNKVFIIGRLTRNPETRVLPSGQMVANFGVATNRVFYDKNRQKQEQTEFHNIVCFGKIAEIANQYLKQGSLALIEGRLQTRKWEDQNGIKRSRTEIITEALQLGPRAIGEKTPQAPSQETTSEEIPIIEEEEEINVKDLPL